MYIDFMKYGRVVGYILAMALLLYGAVTFSLSMNNQDQIAGTLAAMFGLQLLWFLMWVKRSSRPVARVTAPAAVQERTEQRPYRGLKQR